MLVETKARIGLFSIALGAYLPQFPSLVPEFEGQYADFKKTIPDTVELIDGGIVTTKEKAMAAGDAFRAGLTFPSDKLVTAPDGSSARLRRKGFTWDRASHTNALDIGGTGLALAVPEPPLPRSLATAVFQSDSEALTLYVAVEPTADAMVAIGETAPDAGRLWRTLPVSYEIRGYSGDILATGTVETLPQTTKTR